MEAVPVSSHGGPLDALLGLLQSPRVEDRREAMEGLMWHAQLRNAIPQVMRALQDPDRSVAGKAAFALDEHGEYLPDALPYLLELLCSPEPAVRLRAVSSLTYRPIQPTIAASLLPLIELLSDADAQVRYLVGIGLQQTSRAALAEVLKPEVKSQSYCESMFQSRDHMTRMRVALALAEHGDGCVGILAVLLRDADPRVRRAAAVALERVKAGQLELALAASRDPDPDVRLFAIRALRHERAAPIAVYRQALSDADPRVRHAAAVGLERRGADAALALPELVGALQDRDEHVHSAVWGALRKLGPLAEPEVPALLALLRTPEASTRLAAASLLTGALGQYGRMAVPTLLALLEDADAGNRSEAASALLEVCEYHPAADEVRQVMAAVLHHPDEDIRLLAMSSLSRQAEKADLALAALAEALRDPSPAVQIAAGQALWYLGTRARPALSALVEALLDPTPKVRETAAWALEGMGTEAAPALPALLKALDDRDPGVAHFAGRAVVAARPDDPDMVPIYMRLLRGPQMDLRRRTVDALAGLGPSGRIAIPALVELLREEEGDEEFKAVVRAAIEKLGGRVGDRGE